MVRPRRHRFEKGDSNQGAGATGVGGVRIFTLEVIGTGKGDLNFIHGRPWETNAEADAGQDLGHLVQKVVPIIATRPGNETPERENDNHTDNGKRKGGKDL